MLKLHAILATACISLSFVVAAEGQRIRPAVEDTLEQFNSFGQAEKLKSQGLPPSIVQTINIAPKSFFLSADEKQFFGINADNQYVIGEVENPEKVRAITKIEAKQNFNRGYKKLLVTDQSKSDLVPLAVIPFPSFKQALALGEQGIYLVRRQGKEELSQLEGELAAVHFHAADFFADSFKACFSPDESLFAISYGNEGGIHVFSTDTQEKIQFIEGVRFPAVFSKDGKNFYCVSSRDNSMLQVFKTVEQKLVRETESEMNCEPIFLADGIWAGRFGYQGTRLMVNRFNSHGQIVDLKFSWIHDGIYGNGTFSSGGCDDLLATATTFKPYDGSGPTSTLKCWSVPSVDAGKTALTQNEITNRIESDKSNRYTDEARKKRADLVKAVKVDGYEIRINDIASNSKLAFLDGPGAIWVCKLETNALADDDKISNAQNRLSQANTKEKAANAKIPELSKDWKQEGRVARRWIHWSGNSTELILNAVRNGYPRHDIKCSAISTKKYGDIEMSFTAHAKQLAGRLRLRYDPDHPGHGRFKSGVATYGPSIDIDIGRYSGSGTSDWFIPGRTRCLWQTSEPKTEQRKKIEDAAGDEKLYRYKIRLIGNHLRLVINDVLLVDEVIPGFRDTGLICFVANCTTRKETSFKISDLTINELDTKLPNPDQTAESVSPESAIQTKKNN